MTSEGERAEDGEEDCDFTRHLSPSRYCVKTYHWKDWKIVIANDLGCKTCTHLQIYLKSVLRYLKTGGDDMYVVYSANTAEDEARWLDADGNPTDLVVEDLTGTGGLTFVLDVFTGGMHVDRKISFFHLRTDRGVTEWGPYHTAMETTAKERVGDDWEFVLHDGDYQGWRTCMSDSPHPTVRVSMRGGTLHARNAPLAPERIRELINVPSYGEGDIYDDHVLSCWRDNVLELLYHGHLRHALYLINMWDGGWADGGSDNELTSKDARLDWWRAWRKRFESSSVRDLVKGEFDVIARLDECVTEADFEPPAEAALPVFETPPAPPRTEPVFVPETDDEGSTADRYITREYLHEDWRLVEVEDNYRAFSHLLIEHRGVLQHITKGESGYWLRFASSGMYEKLENFTPQGSVNSIRRWKDASGTDTGLAVEEITGQEGVTVFLHEWTGGNRGSMNIRLLRLVPDGSLRYLWWSDTGTEGIRYLHDSFKDEHNGGVADFDRHCLIETVRIVARENSSCLADASDSTIDVKLVWDNPRQCYTPLVEALPREEVERLTTQSASGDGFADVRHITDAVVMLLWHGQVEQARDAVLAYDGPVSLWNNEKQTWWVRAVRGVTESRYWHWVRDMMLADNLKRMNDPLVPAHNENG